jgi:lactate permease
LVKIGKIKNELLMNWYQTYNPTGNSTLSTIIAILPMVVLMALLLFSRLKAYLSALLALTCAFIIAVGFYQMPADKAIASLGFGVFYGFLPIGWIVLNVFFLFRILTKAAVIDGLRSELVAITEDKRLQLLIVAFCFGGMLEGAAGFGTPVAITAAILIGLGFSPLQASILSLLANTAPVAYGGLGTPIIALQGVTGIDLLQLSGMVGLLLTPFGVLVPIWLVWAYAGWKKTREILPVLLAAGISFAVTQLLVSTYHGPWLVGILAGLVSLGVTLIAIQIRGQKTKLKIPDRPQSDHKRKGVSFQIWLPWLVLVVLVLIWGIPQIKSFLDLTTVQIPVPFLDQQIFRVPPVALIPKAETAVFRLNWLSATGTAIFLVALINGLILGFKPQVIAGMFIKAIYEVRYSLLTISGMMALGFVTRFSGMDATLGLAFANAGPLYPFFGTLLGWLGVAITGSDTSSNVLFGSLQRITAEQLGLNPVVMAAANSAGGVMGKMIDAQSIVIASTSTKWFGHEREILRGILLHSLALAILVAVVVTIKIYIF